MTPHDVICISSIDWDFIWQGHQEIMTRLAASGHRVLFIENTGVRPPRMGDLPRVMSRVRNWRRGTKGFREERPNLFIHSPIVVPLPYSRIAQWLNKQILMRGINRWMRAVGVTRPVVWTFLPTPLARAVIAEIDPALTIYYCIDDLASSSHQARKIVSSEQALFKSADLVFVTSERLRARAAQFSSRVHLFPFAVNLGVFQQSRERNEPAPADLAALRPPVAGYVGGLHQWVDQDLLAAVAAQLPDVSFALIGPEQTDVSRLKALPNVHLFGQRPHAELPRYVRGFNVGLVPYRITEYTANVYPTKLNEYLVMGIPVVATDLDEIRRFNAEHGDTVRVAASTDQYAEQVRAAIAETSAPGEIKRRITVAESNSWERRLEQMSTLIDGELDAKAAKTAGWEDRIRRLYGAAKARPAKIAGALLLAYAIIFYTNLVWWVAAPLKVEEPPRPADAIVVFAGGVGESGRAGGGVQERISQAITLYAAGVAPRVIISSGFVFTLREAEQMKAIAIANGVPADAISLEEQAANTYENVVFTRAILDRQGWRRIALVSSPYHMRRAILTWHKVAPEIEVVATPPQSSFFYAHVRGASLEQIRSLLQEYVGIAVLLVGWADLNTTPDSFGPLVQYGLIAFASAVALVPLARRLAIRIDVVARPRADRWHRAVVPLLGGVAIGLATLITSLIAGLAVSLPVVLSASMAMFAMGLVDDIMLLRPATKLVAQIVAAAALVYFGFRLNWLESRLLDSVLTMVWVVGLTNAFNLLDNMDGLCAGIAFIVAAMLLAGFWTGVSRANAIPEMTLLAALAGAAAGFLVYNFPPASIFMGDSGSLLFGFSLAALTLGHQGVRASRSDVLSVIAGPAFVLLIPIFDTTLVTVARLLSGRSPAKGGRDHSSHRLVAIGLSERNAVLVLWLLASVGGAIGLLLRNFSPDWSLPVGAIYLIGMCVFAVYLSRVRVYEDSAPGQIANGFTLVRAEFMNRRRVVEVLVDASLIGASYYGATLFVFRDPEGYLRNAEVFYQSLPVIVITQLVSFFGRGLYRGIWQPFARPDVNKVLEGTLAGIAISQIFLVAYYGYFAVSWKVVLLQALLLAGGVILSRLIGRLIPP